MEMTVKIDAELHRKVKSLAALERTSMELIVECALYTVINGPPIWRKWKRKPSAERRTKEKP
jgi:predicted transcriptional regulator